MLIKTMMKVMVVLVGFGVGGVFTVAPVTAGGPPQPYYADYVSGHVVLSDGSSAAGLILVACLEGCHVYQTEPVEIDEDGNYKLELYPDDRRFIGRSASFYIQNEYGRIRAMERVGFGGGFKSHVVDLSFEGQLPVATGNPSLPLVGDPMVPLIAKGVVGFGGLTLAIGVLLVLLQIRPNRLTRYVRKAS
ncbi:MAG: hypothetical protein VX966_01825 [Chloroflexota bacterium]|nr:hypothetical protein [Chloroflexota bacterium]